MEMERNCDGEFAASGYACFKGTVEKKNTNHLFPLCVFLCTIQTYNVSECAFLLTMKNF